MLLENLVEIAWIWAFLVTFSSINTPKKLVTFYLSGVMPSVSISGNFVGIKRFLEVGWKIVHFVSAFVWKHDIFRSSSPEVFLRKGVLKICSKFTGEYPCQSAISNRTSAWVIYAANNQVFPPFRLRWKTSQQYRH